LSKFFRWHLAFAAPASNLALFAVLKLASAGLASLPLAALDIAAVGRFSLLVEHLARINLILFWFNLLASHPLELMGVAAVRLPLWRIFAPSVRRKGRAGCRRS
jgi:hypothetical protein